METTRFQKFITTGLQLIQIGWPIMLSSTGFMLLQIVDGLYLGHYSSEAVAAIGPAGMAMYLTGAFFSGVIGYTSTLVAHCYGAKKEKAMPVVAWQGIYLAMIFSLVIIALSPFLTKMFRAFNHPPSMCAMEETYYSIMLIVVIVGMFGNAIGGFFIGQGRTKPVMYIQMTGQLMNIVLGYVMIFGYCGFPVMGVAGAAWSSVIAAGTGTLLLVCLFFSKDVRQKYDTWRCRGFNKKYFSLLLRYGVHAGVRFFVDAVVWSGFMMFIGRLGTMETAASSIAFRLNSIVLFPLFGFTEAIRVMIGQAKGRGDNTSVKHVTWTGMVVVQFFMLCGAAFYLLFPRELFLCFAPSNPAEMENFMKIVDVGVILLRFVACYCLLDGVNLVFTTSLQGSGDTRWVMNATIVSHGIFVAIMCYIDRFYRSLYSEWMAITIFVLFLGVMWWLRFLNGHWKECNLIGSTGIEDTKRTESKING